MTKQKAKSNCLISNKHCKPSRITAISKKNVFLVHKQTVSLTFVLNLHHYFDISQKIVIQIIIFF